MFILRDLLIALQAVFSDTEQGRKRKVWFVYTLLAVVVPFTSSITSNLLRALNTLFGMEIKSQRFYTFMASSTLPWSRLWRVMWGLIPDPAITGRIFVALDDSINPKSGKNIFGCGHFHDHAAKGNRSSRKLGNAKKEQDLGNRWLNDNHRIRRLRPQPKGNCYRLRIAAQLQHV